MSPDDPWVVPPRRGDEHLGRDYDEPSDLEMLDIIESMRKLVRHHTIAPYQVDLTSPRGRQACWILVTAINGKPVREASEVTAQWFVARQSAEHGASPRRLGKLLEPSILWLDPTDATNLAIRTRYARWMIAAGGDMRRLGPRRALEIYRGIAGTLSGHDVSIFRPMPVWRETLVGLDELIRWAGPLDGPRGAIAREATLMRGRLQMELGHRDVALTSLLAVQSALEVLATQDALTEDDQMMQVDLELDLMLLDGGLS